MTTRLEACIRACSIRSAHGDTRMLPLVLSTSSPLLKGCAAEVVAVLRVQWLYMIPAGLLLLNMMAAAGPDEAAQGASRR